MERIESYRLTYKVHLAGGQSRLREMIIYVSAKCKDAPRWGKTKLNKILWRADFTSFYERGVPVTGRAYQRLQYGPAPVEMAPMLGEMLNYGLIKISPVEFENGSVEERIEPLTGAGLSVFSPDDLAYVDRAIEYYWDDTAREVSEDSHGMAWKSRENGDPMAYELSYLSDERIPDHVLSRIKKIAEERGWKSE